MTNNTVNIAKKLNLGIIAELGHIIEEKPRPHVVLCKDNLGNKVVLKTANFKDEVAIYNTLRKFLRTGNYKVLAIPEIYKFGKEYLEMEYIEGIVPAKDLGNHDTLSLPYIKQIVKAFWELDALLAQAKGELEKQKLIGSNIKKDQIATVSNWFKNSATRWQKEAKKEFGGQIISIKKINNLAKVISTVFGKAKLKKALSPTYGVFAHHHMVIKGSKVFLFDFGGHLRYRPKFYDIVFLMQPQILHGPLPFSFKDACFREELIKYIKEFKKVSFQMAPLGVRKQYSWRDFSLLFNACLLERTIGWARDVYALTRQGNQQYKNPAYSQEINKRIHILRDYASKQIVAVN